MRIFNHYFLRIFVVLLAIVFITNTVYAGGMMVSASFNSVTESVQFQAADNTVTQHCHDHSRSDQRHDSVGSSTCHQSQHTSQSHSGCGHCTHCLACCSMIPQEHAGLEPISATPVMMVALKALYLSPANPQPNKPPIA